MIKPRRSLPLPKTFSSIGRNIWQLDSRS